MKKKLFKRIMSLVLVVVMAVSTMTVSAVSASAETANVTYCFYIATSGSSNSTSVDKISIKVNGDNGSTGWHNVSYVANDETDCASFSDINVGNIQSITVKNSGIDGWYPEFFKVIVNDTVTTIDGCKWVDDKEEVTFSVTDKSYSFDITTAGSSGKSSDKISIKVNGDNGSTSWHNVGKAANEKKDSASFSDINVGNIQSITVKNDDDDGWYPEFINVTMGDKTTTIYGGRWVDDKNEVTLSVTDKVAKVTVKTSDIDYSGTDASVYVQLFDENDQSSEKITLSDIHPESNAFERNDKSTFYILVPENFGGVSKIETGTGGSIDDKWFLNYIDVTLDGKTQRFYDPEAIDGPSISIDGNQVTLYPAPYIYKVTVSTSDALFGGTNSDIYMLTYNESEELQRFFYLEDSNDNFERDETDVFYITSSERIWNIAMELNGSDDWFLARMKLDRLDITDGKETVVESVGYEFNHHFEANTACKPKHIETLPIPDTTYKFEFSTAGSDGGTTDDFMIKVNGTKGSTAWHEINEKVTQGKNIKHEFNCRNVGSIESVTVHVLGDDKWYPEKIKITKGEETTTIYGGRWIDGYETTLHKSDAVYELKIKTGDQTLAGTDCPVYATLIDAYADSSIKVNLSDIYPKSNAFERKEESTFYIYPNGDFTKLMYVNIESSSNGTASSNWYIDDISAKQVQGKNIGDGFTVDANQWDVNDNVMSFGRESGAVGTFEVEIKTADKFQAGTDGKIYLQLVGKNGFRCSSTVCIDDYMETYTPGNNYERGDVDKCRITFDISHLKEGLDELEAIRIYNGGGGTGPDWKVDYIKVTEILPDGTKGKTYQSTVNDWIRDYNPIDYKYHSCPF